MRSLISLWGYFSFQANGTPQEDTKQNKSTVDELTPATKEDISKIEEPAKNENNNNKTISVG